MENKDPNWTPEGRQFLKLVKPGDRFPIGARLLSLEFEEEILMVATVTDPVVRDRNLMFSSSCGGVVSYHRYPLESLVSWHEHTVYADSPWFQKPEEKQQQTVSLRRDTDKIWVTSDVDFTLEQRKRLVKWNAEPATGRLIDNARCWFVPVGSADGIAQGLIVEGLESFFKGQGATVVRQRDRKPLFPKRDTMDQPVEQQKVTVRTYTVPQVGGLPKSQDLILVNSTMDFTSAQQVFMLNLGLHWKRPLIRTTGWVLVENAAWVARRLRDDFPDRESKSKVLVEIVGRVPAP